jgi:GntR family transcriptional regulator of vanillate catabolism
VPTGERSRLVDEVSSQLRDLILTHQLEPGAKLVQTRLAARLGVSRTPLREAIRLLEQDGLVRVANGNGTVEVINITPHELRELYEIREVVDGLAARLLARRGLTPTAEQTMSGALEDMRRSIRPLKGDRFFVAHLQFHVAIVEHCGNERLRAQLHLVRLTAGSMRDVFPVALRLASRARGESPTRFVNRVIGDHARILDAIRSGDGELAERCARAHIGRTLDDYVNPMCPVDVAIHNLGSSIERNIDLSGSST